MSSQSKAPEAPRGMANIKDYVQMQLRGRRMMQVPQQHAMNAVAGSILSESQNFCKTHGKAWHAPQHYGWMRSQVASRVRAKMHVKHMEKQGC